MLIIMQPGRTFESFSQGRPGDLWPGGRHRCRSHEASPAALRSSAARLWI